MGTIVRPWQADFDALRHVSGGGGLVCQYAAGVVNGTALTTGSPTNNNLRALPFVSPRGGTIDRIGIRVTTGGGAGSVARIGLYRPTSRSNLYPSALVVASGELDTNVTGLVSVAVSVPVREGDILWAAHLSGVAAATLRIPAVAGLAPVFGSPDDPGGTVNIGITVALAYGALPATFTAGGTFLTATPPGIFLRFSS